jgi:hypothetical protein
MLNLEWFSIVLMDGICVRVISRHCHCLLKLLVLIGRKRCIVILLRHHQKTTIWVQSMILGWSCISSWTKLHLVTLSICHSSSYNFTVILDFSIGWLLSWRVILRGITWERSTSIHCWWSITQRSRHPIRACWICMLFIHLMS